MTFRQYKEKILFNFIVFHFIFLKIINYILTFDEVVGKFKKEDFYANKQSN